MNRLILLGLISIFLAACNSDLKPVQSSLSGKMEIRKSWVRPVKAQSNSAAYLSVINRTAKADTLLAVSSEDFKMAEVHESYETEDGLSGMRPAEDLSIAPGDSLVLKPAGLHLMLMQAKQTLAVPDSVTISFSFKIAGKKVIKVPVRATN